MSLNKLKKILSSESHNNLDSIVQRAKNMEELRFILKKTLSDDAAQHLIACNIRSSGKLIILCNSNAWATKFRYQSTLFLSAARKRFPSISDCQIKVTNI
jgi:hypothetical protein|tara:strand:+ start:440 stop:739 length:300 start_codon:yes stop_codon:yes gene_type:complete